MRGGEKTRHSLAAWAAPITRRRPRRPEKALAPGRSSERRSFLRRPRGSKLGKTFETPLLSAPALLLVVGAFFVPLVILVIYSFWPTVYGTIIHDFTLSNYRRFFSQSTYWGSLVRSFAFVGIASGLTCLLTLPFAYFVATKVRPSRRLLWLLVATVPFFTSYLIRVFTWLNMLGDGGIINKALKRTGLIDQPLGLLAPGKPAVVITFMYLLFPLAFLTTYIAIERMNPATLEAAADLGAQPWRSLLYITLPIARTGIIGGFIFSFITMMGDYVTPQLIGGTSGTLYSNLIVNQYGDSLEWGFGSALALLLLLSIFLLLIVLRVAAGGVESTGEYTRGFTHRRSPVLFAYAVLTIVYLYLPIALLVLLAFNDSQTVGLPFAGFTTEWFSSVFHNTVLQEALWTSLKVAFAAVGISLITGTLAAVQLARTRGRMRNLTLGSIAMPLFLPPVVLGLAIIVGLNSLGLQRGLWTIIAGHTVLTLPIVTLLVMVRLEGLDPNQELAALDLGARPWQALLRVSIPQALPGIIAAAMISFATSMDEFIMTFLVTGSQTTLPLYIYGSLRFGATPDLNAVSSLILALSFILIFAGTLIAVGRQRVGRKGPGALPLAA
jgi:ABC-type spermidine/putrescine transport system permease subunit II